MKLERVKNLNEEMLKIDPDISGYKIMQDKTQILGFKIQNLNLPAAMILKQDALSVGAEVATPSGAIFCKTQEFDCLLFGSLKSLKLLAKKLSKQPCGLRFLSNDLKRFLRVGIDCVLLDSRGKNLLSSCDYNDTCHTHKKLIMSVINVDSNSFYKEYSVSDAIERIYKDIELGADIIDIGAVSSRPGAKHVGYKEEIKRLDSIFREVRVMNIATKIRFSIDTYNNECAIKALESGFSIINDISGNVENMLEIFKGNLQGNPSVWYILMHIKGSPQNMMDLCAYENLILDIDNYFTKKLEILESIDFKNVILDVGIGFAKKGGQNIELLQKLRHFKHFKKPLLVGLSHKRFLGEILGDIESAFKNKHKDTTENRLIASVIANFIALQNGADIIRVHDVKEHKQMMKIFEGFRVEDVDWV